MSHATEESPASMEGDEGEAPAARSSEMEEQQRTKNHSVLLRRRSETSRDCCNVIPALQTTRAVTVLRFSVMILLLITAVVVCVGFYIYTRHNEEGQEHRHANCKRTCRPSHKKSMLNNKRFLLAWLGASSWALAERRHDSILPDDRVRMDAAVGQQLFCQRTRLIREPLLSHELYTCSIKQSKALQSYSSLPSGQGIGQGVSPRHFVDRQESANGAKVPAQASNEVPRVTNQDVDNKMDEGKWKSSGSCDSEPMIAFAVALLLLLALMMMVLPVLRKGLVASKKNKKKRDCVLVPNGHAFVLMVSLLFPTSMAFQLAVPLGHCAGKLLLEQALPFKSKLVCSAVVSPVEGDNHSSSTPRRTTSTAEPNTKKPRSSRAERKALERAQKARRKNNGHRRHNYADRKDQLRGRQPGEGPLELHSTVIPELNQNSTADEVMRAIKRAQNLHDRHDLKAISRFLLEHTDDSFAYGYKGSMLARLAVAALHVNSHSIASVAIDYRRANFRSSMLPMESAAIVRNLLRVHNVTTAWHILEDELSLPLEGSKLDSSRSQDRLVHRANALSSIASRHFFEGEARAGVHACNTLAAMGPILGEAKVTGERLGLPWPRILQGAARCQTLLRNETLSVDVETTEGPVDEIKKTHVPCNIVYSVLNAMINLPSENDSRAYERLSNALVRRVVFVTGAVGMDGCPPADRGEAAFVGRSNVGKSSLVNMVTNRKSLAYTSKRPGKTQQFNFFAVNDKPELERQIRYGDDIPGEKDADSFYIVDLPGFGYAKVPDKQRLEWAAFMGEYISTRPNLRVLFHLVDSRHGPTEEDELIMRQVSQSLPDYARYVIVLTKGDKNVKGPNNKFTGKVTDQVLDRLRDSMSEHLPVHHDVPVILTSAESKLGRDEMWRYLCRAATF